MPFHKEASADMFKNILLHFVSLSYLDISDNSIRELFYVSAGLLFG